MADGHLGDSGDHAMLTALDQILGGMVRRQEPEPAPSPNPRMEADNAMVAVLKRAPAGKLVQG